MIELRLDSIAKGHLTTQSYSSVFGEFVDKASKIAPGERVLVDLQNVEWIDHLPLLSLCLILRECVTREADCEVVLPVNEERNAFLERWGFFNLLDSFGIAASLSDNREPFLETEYSRVLPITYFENINGAAIARDALLHAEDELLRVLRHHAHLGDRDIAGLADLVIFELCKNVTEHSRSNSGGFAIAHASKSNPNQINVRNRFAASWEKRFFDATGGEGVTEIVIGDAGVGIISTLQEISQQKGIRSPQEILHFAFEPYSTCKKEITSKVRGLWCVKQKVRDLGGVLFVRSCSRTSEISLQNSTNASSVAAYWDFFNDPNQEKPHVVKEAVPFPGTQIQIILPQLNIERPKTYVALSQKVSGKLKLEAKSALIPKTPGAAAVSLLNKALTSLQRSEVLFINMSLLDDEWRREDVHDVMEEVCKQIKGASTPRVWMLNPSERIIELMKESEAVLQMWSQSGVMIPVVSLLNYWEPKAFAIPVRIESGTADLGDTALARERLFTKVWEVVETGSKPEAEIFDGLGAKERAWLEDALYHNYAIVHKARKDLVPRLVPEFDIVDLAETSAMMLLPFEIEAVIARAVSEDQSSGRKWYRLTSNLYADRYVNDRILYELKPDLRRRVDTWIEKSVASMKPTPRFVISYTEVGNALLARVLNADGNCRPIYLGNYLDLHAEHGLDPLDQIGVGDNVLVLLDIAGSGKTLSKLLDKIYTRKAHAHVLSVIDTIGEADKQRHPHVDALYRTNRVRSLVSYPITKYPTIPETKEERNWTVVNIDPLTLLPVSEISDSGTLLTDFDFWELVAQAGALTTTPITYKGHEFGSFISLSSLFNFKVCAKRIASHLASCIGQAKPDYLLVPQSTVDFISTRSQLRTELNQYFAHDRIVWEGDSTQLQELKLENKSVAIFVGAATSGSEIARFMRTCRLASRVHISVFINRMAHDIASAFVRRKGVTFSAFQRLYGSSPSLNHRSYRTSALRSLDAYRRSCLSNRLLLFVDHQTTLLNQTHTFLESPAQLLSTPGLVADPISGMPAQPCLTRYDLRTAGGCKAIKELIVAWSLQDTTVLEAILQEAACRYETADDSKSVINYTCSVLALYRECSAANVKDEMLGLLLTHLILERLPGQRIINDPNMPNCLFLWDDCQKATMQGKLPLAKAALRTCSKLNPQLILDRLAETVSFCAESRELELTLSLELSKMFDEPDFANSVNSAVVECVKNLYSQSSNYSIGSRIAIRDLLRDMGMVADHHDKIRPMEWNEVFRLLKAQPHDLPRAVRASIRSIRSHFPRANIAFFRFLPSGRYVSVDMWPQRVISSAFISSDSFITHGILQSRSEFFSSNLGGESDPYAQQLWRAIQSLLKESGASSASVFIAKIGFSPGSGMHFGLLRCIFPFGSSEMAFTEAQKRTLFGISTGLEDLLLRPGATLVAKIADWQFQHAVNGLGLEDSIEGTQQRTLQTLVDMMRDLTEADLGRVAILDSVTRTWISGPVSGEGWENSKRDICIGEDDVHSATVAAAKSGEHCRIHDVQSKEANAKPPNSWVRGCLILPLKDDEKRCNVVVTLWHHVPSWFPEFDKRLASSMIALGNALIRITKRIQERELREKDSMLKFMAWHIAHSIKNELPEESFKALSLSVDPVKIQSAAKKCEVCVKDVHRLVRRFLSLADMETFKPDATPYTGAELFTRINSDLRERVESHNLFIGENRVIFEGCEYREFQGTVVCNLSGLIDDLSELLTNSAKHGGGNACIAQTLRITLTVRASSISERAIPTLHPDTQYAVIEYIDDGVGIPASKKDAVFEMNLPATFSTNVAGSLRLGLPLARKLARKLNGELLEIGSMGRGVHFQFFFPLSSETTNESH